MAGHRGDEQLVKDALATGDAEARVAALGAALRLKILDDKTLKTSFGDPDVIVRRRAAELAPRLNADSAGTAAGLAKALLQLLNDEACAEVAAFALGELEVTDAAVVKALETQAVDHDDALCRESAVAALGALGEGRAVVLAALDDVATVRRRAVIALANFDGEDVEAALRGALEDRDWQVRQAAEDLLA